MPLSRRKSGARGWGKEANLRIADGRQECPQPRNLLAAYIDDALDLTERDVLAAYLARCPRCRAAARNQRQIKQLSAPTVLPIHPVPAHRVEETQRQLGWQR